MRGLVLAAGFGTRLRPYSEHVPKALMPVCGEPLLGRALRLLASQGVGPLIVNTHFLHETIVEYAARASTPFAISHERDRIRGTGGGICFAREFLSHDDDCCVCNAEPLRELALGPLVDVFRRSGAACGLVSVPVKSGATIFGDLLTGAYLGTRADDLSKVDKTEFCWIGIAFYRREFLSLFTDADFSVVPVWRRAQESGMSVAILPAPATTYWRDVGTPAELLRVHLDVVDGLSPYAAPAELVHDRDRAAVYPRSLPRAQRDQIGRRVWIELTPIPPGARFERALVLAGAHLDEGQNYHDCVVTAWGVMPIDTR